MAVATYYGNARLIKHALSLLVNGGETIAVYSQMQIHKHSCTTFTILDFISTTVLMNTPLTGVTGE
jgi:hypothetical protein